MNRTSAIDNARVVSTPIRNRATGLAGLAVLLGSLAFSAAPALAQTGLQFNGSTQYATMGAAPSLNTASFTLECWVRRSGTSVTTNTGTSPQGWNAIVPLVTKGRAEADTPANLNTNYFLGIRSDGVLCADFEEGSGPNHPLGGTTALITGVWYHVATTFDQTTGRYRIYVNGEIQKDTTLTGGISPVTTSIQHAAIGTAINSSGVAAGFFGGTLDEVRIWSVARTPAEIQGNLFNELSSGTGLLARWGLNDGSGTTAVNSVGGGVSGTLVATPTWVSGSPFGFGMQFAGTSGYGTFGNPAALQLSQFTLEMWVRRDATGVGTSTGTGGIADAVPLIAKGRAEAETPTQDINYLFGISQSSGKLVADFEEGTGGTSPSLNHPITGTGTIAADGTWHHVAATYDGSSWKLYLDGALDASLSVGQPPASSSISAVSIGSALTSTGVAAGFFNGAVDEVRVWNSARSAAQISSTMNSRITSPQSGLVARWGLDEGYGAVVRDTSGSAAHGNMLPAAPTSAWNWSGGAPFNIVVSPPADPSNLVATAVSYGQVTVTWNDNSSNETSFELERSTTGAGGPYSLLASLPAGTTSYIDVGLTASTQYCYRVRAVGSAGPSGYAASNCATTPAEAASSLDLGGTNAYLNAGTAASLQLSQFTLEMWIRRDGTGVGTSTGTGGIADAVPLIAKGRAEAETPTQDINYLFGISQSSGKLVADFEEGTGGSSPSLNHPITGNTVIPVNASVWHHVAATYDGSSWKLYLDGQLDGTLSVGQPPASGSTVAVAVGSALTSTGVASGFFDGAIDEVRVWNRALSASELQDGINQQITSGTGLVSRWGLNEGAGAYAFNSVPMTPATVTGANYTWGASSPFSASITHNITASSGGNGLVTPAGVTAVPHHGSQAYTIAPLSGYHVASVLVDGVGVGTPSSYTFTDVTADHTISATFAIDTYTIAYDGNGSTGGAAPVDPSSPYSYNTIVTVLGAETLTRTGYTFAGWNSAANGSGTSYAPAATFAATSNLTLYAQWTANTFTLLYNGNGNTGGAAPVDAGSPYNESATVTVLGAGSLTRTGYTFAGWNTAANGSGTSYAPAATFSITANTTLYAQWTIDTFTLTYEGNGNTGGAAPVDPASPYDYNTTVTVLGEGTLTRTGHAFTGWNTAADGSGTSYAPASTFAITASTVLYAQWTLNTYAVTYDGNGNTGGAAPVDPGSPYNYNATVTVLGAGTLARTGYTFAGWNTAANGSGTSYAPAATFAATSDITLYAQWTIETYTVVYAGNGNTGGAAPVDPGSPHDYNTTVTVLGAGTLTKTGYVFAGWNTSADGSGASYAPATTFAATTNLTFFAQWTINTFTVTYDGNGNTGGAAPADPSSPYNFNSTVTVLGAGSLTRTGYTFAGWNTAANGSGTSYAPAATFSIAMNTTLYAQWTIDTFTLVYDGNGNTGGAAPVDPGSPYDFNSTVTVLGAGSLTRSGYTFTGWNTAANGSGTSYAPAATFSIAANTTLYAQWTIDTFTLVYDGNGNTGGAAPVDPGSPYDFNSTVTVLGAGSLTRTGYTFAGWNTAANGSGTSYAPATTFSIAANTTLYAQWTIDTFTLVYDGNGNTGGAAPVDPGSPYDFNSTVTVLGAGSLTRTGYSFVSWNTAADGSGTSYAPAATFTIAADATLYAQWTASGAEFALDLGSANAYVNFGAPASLQLTQLTIEMWMRRDGAGTGTNTGTGGIADAIPLLAKGRADVEDPTKDINYLFGIKASSGALCADFEEGPGGTGPVSLNHPILGTTPVTSGVWHHVAVTYDGTWKLYLDGVLDGSLAVNQPLGSLSTVAVSLGTALTQAGAAAGFFDGATDEVRIWNVARTQAQIQSTINSRITSAQSGLVARWALDEGSGTAVNGSAGTTINGAIVGTGSSWIAPAPFNDATSAPAAPTDLAVVANSSSQATLTWTDNSGDESQFEIERSAVGSGGPFTAIATVAANTTTYVNSGLSPSSGYCYRVRASNSAGSSDYTAVVCIDTPLPEEFALDLGSASAYVNFGAPASLQLTQVTIEMWMRRDGAGTGTNTGANGIADAIPLLAKGRADVEVAANDINYLFGIQASTGLLCADFEEGPAGASPSLNHPILGTTPVTSGVWHHVAVTYDGTWKLYLDGALDGSLAVNQPLASSSTVPVSLGTALTLAGVAAGSFDGATDEVRIWNVARTQAQIQSTINSRITSAQSGLVARWALDEGTGTAVNGSAGTTINGAIVGTGSSWIAPAPFNATSNGAPQITALVSPANGATGVSLDPTLAVQVSDAENDPISVSFYGRVVTTAAGADFTLIGLPDTQYYASSLNGGSPAIMNAQTQWIVDQRAARNISYAVQLGDCVQNGDNSGNDIEWQNANTAFNLIENPVTTGLPEGMPYGVCVGNHDQSPIGDANGTTAFYNQYFGESRFNGRTYYGGHYGVNNNNWYDLFSASGMDFIVISMEYNTAPSAAVLSWADGLLTTYANRRAIIATHNLVGSGNPAAFSAQGQAIYTALRGHSNVFLMLGGHVTEEGRRTDTYNGNTVYSLLSDYQARTNGGNGWLRIYEFSPANNVIRVRTFSPWLNQFEADADSSSQFTLPYDMSSVTTYALIGTVNGVASGGTASITWPGLTATTPYEWYGTASDAGALTAGPAWNFTTGSDALSADSQLPVRVSFSHVSPNPSFNSAHVMLELPIQARAHVEVMDIQGRVVATVADGTFSAGRHDIRWSVTRAGMAPGLFFLRAKVGSEVFVRRFTVIH